MEWDDLVWKATTVYNFFPTESSEMAPFFLMFGHEAAVKYTLLESERPKYLGTDDSMINIELMTKLLGSSTQPDRSKKSQRWK